MTSVMIQKPLYMLWSSFIKLWYNHIYSHQKLTIVWYASIITSYLKHVKLYLMIQLQPTNHAYYHVVHWFSTWKTRRGERPPGAGHGRRALPGAATAAAAGGLEADVWGSSWPRWNRNGYWYNHMYIINGISWVFLIWFVGDRNRDNHRDNHENRTIEQCSKPLVGWWLGLIVLPILQGGAP